MQFQVGEALGLALQRTNAVDPLVRLQQVVQLAFQGWSQGLLKSLRESSALTGDDSAHQILQEAIPWCDQALLLKVPQGLTQDVERLRREHGDAPRLLLQVRSGGLVAQAVAEQVEHALLLAKAGRLGQRLDSLHVALGEVTLQDVLQVIQHRRVLVGKEPSLRLEVAELQNQVHGGRCGVHALHGVPLHGTQVEIAQPVGFVETRQAIEVIDLLGGQDRQAARIGGHGRARLSECRK